MNKILASQRFFIVGFLVVLVVFLGTYDIPFFWDSLSKSKRATWFYENNFSQWVVPTEINSGHPPFWTLLLAIVWKIFGRTLLVSRLLLLLLNVLVVFQIQVLIKKYKVPNISWFWYLILFIEPTYLAQTTIMNNDVLLLFMSLLAFNNITKNRLLYSLSLLGVLMCNLRGVLFFSAFFLFDLVIYIVVQKQYKKILNYVFPVLGYICFLGYQYSVLGWILKAPRGNWDSQRQLVDVKHFIVNVIASVWVIGDFGRFMFWVSIITCIYIALKKRVKIDRKTKELMFFGVSLLVCNLSVMWFSSNPIGHRYFMLVYLLGLFVFVNLIFAILSEKKKAIIVFLSTVIILVSGHFWIYPETISQGWDSSLAYLNYFEVKKKMQAYVLENQLPINNIGAKTRNPSLGIEYLKEGSQVEYVEDFNMESIKYYLHSNIENGTKDAAVFELKNNWELVKEYEKGGVFVRLYKNFRLE